MHTILPFPKIISLLKRKEICFLGDYRYFYNFARPVQRSRRIFIVSVLVSAINSTAPQRNRFNKVRNSCSGFFQGKPRYFKLWPFLFISSQKLNHLSYVVFTFKSVKTLRGTLIKDIMVISFNVQEKYFDQNQLREK